MSPDKLISAGYALVPIPCGKKSPAHKGWQRQDRVITKPSSLHVLHGKNVGLAHAYCSPTPTCALDVDNFPLALTWLTGRGVALNDLLMADNAVVIWSGKKHSLKLLYRLPPGSAPRVSKKVVHNKKTTVLEFRCATKGGNTVQDVLPPSLHPDGMRYQWLGAGTPLNLPQIPADLFALWDNLLQVKKTHKSKPLTVFRPETPRSVAQLKAMLQCVSADCDYETWRNLVWAILSTGWACAEDVAQEWSQSTPSRYDDEAFWTVVNSYDPDHEPKVSLGTVYHHARLGGWYD
jgi:putative DNA primase/helicase